jgi:hypothetical protein
MIHLPLPLGEYSRQGCLMKKVGKYNLYHTLGEGSFGKVKVRALLNASKG